MARTNMKWARVAKEQAAKLAKIRSSGKREYVKVSSIEQGMSSWLLNVVINPIGNTYHWFVFGRKSCRETGLSVDRDGYRYCKQYGLYQRGNMTGWKKRKLIK